MADKAKQDTKKGMEIENDKKKLEGDKNQPQAIDNLDEDDDDFEDFEVDNWSEGEENKIDIKQWQEDWDDEDVEDEFSNQLRKELKLEKPQN